MKRLFINIYHNSLSLLSFFLFIIKKILTKESYRDYYKPILISPNSFLFNSEGSDYVRFHGFILRNVVLNKIPKRTIGFRTEYVNSITNDFKVFFIDEGKSSSRKDFSTYQSLFLDLKEGAFKYNTSVFSSKNLCVGISDDGEIIFLTGNHRVAMARLMRLDMIPVQVSFRTKAWHHKRKSILQSLANHNVEDWMKSYLNHPDIKDYVK